MPNRSSYRPSQKSYILGQTSRESTLKEARAIIENALIVNPTMPATELAQLLFQHSEPEFQESLNAVLCQEFYARNIRSIRRKQAAADREQFKLPGFEHLPLKIPGPKGLPIQLLDANVSTVKQYYWSLMGKYSDRKRADPKIKEAKALWQAMKKGAEHEQGITVRQVLLLRQI